MALTASFDGAIGSLARDIETITSLSSLRPLASGLVPQAAALQVLEKQIDDLESQMAEIQSFVASERIALELLAKVHSSAQGQTQVLSHLSHNLPPHLPQLGAIKQPLKERASSKAEALTLMGLVTVEELKDVPSTTRERCTLEELNDLVHYIDAALTKKKRLLAASKDSLTARERDKKAILHRTGLKASLLFITEKELSSAVSSKSRGKARAMVNTLRHLGRLHMHSSKGEATYHLK